MKKQFLAVGKEAIAEAGIMTSTVTLGLGTIILLVALITRISSF